MHPGADQFISCSEDDTVRLWDTNTSNCCGKLLLSQPYLAAFDPSANVFAVASEAAQTILLYDFRQYDKEPFATFDILQHAHDVASDMQLNGQNVPLVNITKGWNKLEFSNDGKSLLLGTRGPGHFLLDAFDGTLRAYLYREQKGAHRLAAGEHNPELVNASDRLLESSGECCFSPDGRYVLSGVRNENVLVWDTLKVTNVRRSRPIHTLEMKSEAGVLAFNPRYNFFATADKELIFWVPDPHADTE
jgi:COMPASS component SWD2